MSSPATAPTERSAPDAVEPAPRAPAAAGVARRLLWAIAVASAAVAAIGAVAQHGHASRRLAGDGRGPGRWAAVADAGEAYRAWQAAGVHGRRLLLLSGRWARPRSGTVGEDSRRAIVQLPSPIDADNAVFAAAMSGIARSIEVVMPPAAFTQRRSQASIRKEYAGEDGAFTQPYETLERRFATPRAFRAADEPVLLLVEPSFFADGAPADLVEWLRARGVVFDLALVALQDPEADGAQVEAARLLAARVGAGALEGRP